MAKPKTESPQSLPLESQDILLLLPAAAAALLGVSVDTLADWRCRGGGPRYVRVGRLIRYRDADLQAWLATRVCVNTGTYPRRSR